MNAVITIIQIVVALSLIVVVILQNRGSDTGMAYGASAGQSYRSKQGLEKFLFYATIILAALFAGFSILSVLI